jgi:hypothetical protein
MQTRYPVTLWHKRGPRFKVAPRFRVQSRQGLKHNYYHRLH